MKVVSVSGAIVLLSASMLVAPETASARPVAGAHVPIVYRAGRLICYYPFGRRGPGYYPCRRPHVARTTRFPHAVPARVRLREPRVSRAAEIRTPRLRPHHAHQGGGHGGGHGPGGGHHIGGRPGGHHMGLGQMGLGQMGGGDRTIVRRPVGGSFGGAPLHSGRAGPAPVRSSYGHAGYPGAGSLRGYPSAVPMRSPAVGGGLHMGAPMSGAPLGGGMRMGTPTAGAPMGGGMHVGAPMGAAPAPAMHMPAAPAIHAPAAAAPAPAIHAPAAALTGHH